MTLTILDPDVSREFIAERRAQGLDRWDEVWDGEYIVMTQPNDEHQDLVAGLTSTFYDVVQRAGMGKVRPGVNVSDRIDDWQENFRCPDVVVFLNDNPAENHDAFWCGGPDLAVEIVSRGDRSRDKLGFYASIGTRELLIIDRAPWQLELYRLSNGVLQLAGRSTVEDPEWLESGVSALQFRLAAGESRPVIEVTHPPSKQEWTI